MNPKCPCLIHLRNLVNLLFPFLHRWKEISKYGWRIGSTKSFLIRQSELGINGFLMPPNACMRLTSLLDPTRAILIIRSTEITFSKYTDELRIVLTFDVNLPNAWFSIVCHTQPIYLREHVPKEAGHLDWTTVLFRFARVIFSGCLATDLHTFYKGHDSAENNHHHHTFHKSWY